MKHFYMILLISMFFSSCIYEEKELLGIYVPASYINTFDTIQLMVNGNYNRKLYDRNHNLVLEMNGKWSVSSDVITFEHPYYNNYDIDLIQFPEYINDTIGNGLGYIWKRGNKLEFCIGNYAVDLPDQNCYVRIK